MATETNGYPNRQGDIEKRNFNVKRFLLKYIRYWYFFVLSLGLTIAIAKYYNWYATPVYRSSCQIIIKDENYGNTAENLLKDLNDYKRNRNLENEIQILKSNSLITRAVQQLELGVTYILKGKIKTAELYKTSPFVLTPDTLNEVAFFTPINVEIHDDVHYKISYKIMSSGKVVTTNHRIGDAVINELGKFRLDRRKGIDFNMFNDPAYDKRNFIAYFNPVENIASYYAGSLNIEVVASGSSILQLSVMDVVPEQCSDFLNKLTEVYIQNSIEQKNLLASNSIRFIDQQIQQVSEELRQIEGSLLDLKTKRGIIDIDEESKVFLDQVRDYDGRISEVDAQLSFVNYLEKYILENKKINDIAPASLGINDPLLIKLISGLSELENERERKQHEYQVKSPAIANLDQQIKKAKTGILENLANIRESYKASKSEASAQLGKIEGKMRNMPRNEIELIGIKRQFSVKEGLYLYLLQKRSENAILLASTVSDNWVIDKAQPSFSPVKPVKSRSYAIAIVLGLVFPAFFIFLKEMLNDKITDKEVLEGNTRIPLMGMISFSEESLSLFSEKKPSAVFMEAFRAVRTNIKYFLSDAAAAQKQNVILITSSISTEGKTFCSYNLAGIFALSEKKTVLVCMDLRKPKMPEGFRLRKSDGVSNYLAGTSAIEEVIQPSGVYPDLDIILSGPIPPNPSELLMKERTDKLFEYLREKYDYVIVDTPPIGLVTDGVVLSKYSDVNMYVVRQNVTRKQHLQFVNKLYEDGKMKNMGIVFNAVKLSRAEYGYGYGYGYGYSYGQESEARRKRPLQGIFKKSSPV